MKEELMRRKCRRKRKRREKEEKDEDGKTRVRRKKQKNFKEKENNFWNVHKWDWTMGKDNDGLKGHLLT